MYKPIWGYVLTNPKTGTDDEIPAFGNDMWEDMCSICQELI